MRSFLKKQAWFVALALTISLGLLATSAGRGRAQSAASAISLDEAASQLQSTTHQFVQGIPTDWTHRHLVFSRPEVGSDAEFSAQKEARFWMQQIRRNLPPDTGSATSNAYIGGVAIQPMLTARQAKTRARLHRDWSQSLGSGGIVGAEMFPAKFSFTTGGTPNCANATTPDYVVFNTNLPNSATQASLIAFDNLYATTCTGTVPLTYWAYNTGGTAKTSVALSTDGTQVAFVQSVGTTANLVLLKWLKSPTTHAVTGTITNGSAGITATGGTIVQGDVGAHITGTGIQANTYITAVTGTTATMSLAATGNGSNPTVNAETVGAPGVPVSFSNGTYRGCPAPCMTTIPFAGTPNDTNSAPYPNYTGDTIYVGADNGTLHKFTGVFAGTPAEAGSPWPSTVHASTILSSPVFDATSTNIFVGDASGRGSFVPASTGVVSGTTISMGFNIVDAPIVDSSTSKVFWFGQAASNPITDRLIQTTTALGSAVTISLPNSGSTTATGNMHSGAFDNLYFTSVATGHLYFCAVNSGSRNHPALFDVGFNASGVMASSVANGPLDMGSPSANQNECSPLTEFLNGSTDRLFGGVQANGNLTGCSSSTGCLYSFNITSSFPGDSTAGLAVATGTSGIVVDNSSGSTGASQVYFSPLGGGASQASQSGLN